MTRRERIEARLAKRAEWAQGRRAKAAANFNAAFEQIKHIPPGQPILVGHHSERHHRRDLERHDSKMRAAFESQDMAKRHEQVAETLETALESSIFSDDENAVEALEARIKEREAEIDRLKALNAAIRKEYKTGLQAGWLDRIGATEEERKAILRNAQFSTSPMFQPYTISNRRGRITADKKRLEQIKRRQKIAEEAEAAPGGVLVKRHPDCNWCVVTFAEKPDRSTIDALKAAGYRWGGGSWQGRLDALPAGTE